MDPKGMKPPVPEGMEMPPVMQESSPMAMCRAMMTSVAASAEMAGHATPEMRTLFEEWARSVEDEMLAVLRARGPLGLAALAAVLKISPDSALHFLGKLAREGKATISGTQVIGVA